MRRRIAFAFGKDGELRLYFSEATGAAENGKIYKIEDGKASNTKLIYNKNCIT
jgi:hypothetical protein